MHNTTPSNRYHLGRMLFRAAMIVAVPVIFLLCALLVVLAQLGQGEA
jgi:hypothetical protein